MGARENAVTNACREVLDILGVPHVRLNSGMAWRGKCPVKLAEPGWPDLVGVLPNGRFLGVECKAPEMLGLYRKKRAGTRSAVQIAIHQRLAKQGALILTVTSSAEMMKDLEQEGYGR